MMNRKPVKALIDSVRVEAPARLHLGFLDLNGGLGRRFGSLGLTLAGLSTELDVIPAKTLQVEGPGWKRVLACAASLIQQLDLPPGVAIRIRRAIPGHIGLGSGTQLSLAVAAGLSQLYGLGLDVRTLARLVQRGQRSGIGIGAFETGGFIIDGGRGERTDPPPVIMQREFPEPWRIVLVFDQRGPGIHGSQEVSAFQSLPQFPARQAEALCRLVLMQALPALAERDCDLFGRAIGRLQQAVGDHFAPVQRGRFASPDVAEVLAWIESQGIAGVGQSSWGPTGFAIVDSEERAARLLADIRTRYCGRTSLHFQSVCARNYGHRIDVRHSSPTREALRAAI